MTCACARALKEETHFRSTGCTRSYWHSVCKRHAVHHFSHPAKSTVLISFVHVTKSGNVTCGHQKLPKSELYFHTGIITHFQKQPLAMLHSNPSNYVCEPYCPNIHPPPSQRTPLQEGPSVKERCEEPLRNSPQPIHG